MRTHLCLGVTLTLTLIACAPSMDTGDTVDTVTLRAAPETTTAGGAVTLTLRSGDDGDIGYNLCTSGLQRRAGESWQPVPEDRVCTMELRILMAGGEASITLDLPADLAPGDYRYETRIEEMATGGAGSVASNVFRVDARNG